MEAVVKYGEFEQLEKVLLGGDLSVLSAVERLNYYKKVCDSLGLNNLTKPFDFLKLNNRLVLYATKSCTDQLRSIHDVSISIADTKKEQDLFMVIARATDKTGRADEEIGAVCLTGLTKEALANQIMKCYTKAKRRVTLSICGLGYLDETEIETIPDAKKIQVNIETGEINGNYFPETTKDAEVHVLPEPEKPKERDLIRPELLKNVFEKKFNKLMKEKKERDIKKIDARFMMSLDNLSKDKLQREMLLEHLTGEKSRAAVPLLWKVAINDWINSQKNGEVWEADPMAVKEFELLMKYLDDLNSLKNPNLEEADQDFANNIFGKE